MRIICTTNKGRALSAKYFSLGYAQASEFNLSEGREYDVFAVSIWQGALFFLIADETGLPIWQPVDLFRVSDGKLPTDWFFSRETAIENGVEALWGYERMATDPGHYEALVEQDPQALKYFYMAAGGKVTSG